MLCRTPNHQSKTLPADYPEADREAGDGLAKPVHGRRFVE